MRTDHDTNYKQLFAHPELVCELLTSFLPGSFAGPLNAPDCQRINGSYASETGHQRHGDMVWRVCRRDDPVGVLVLLEFQSQPDRWMALRMQVYAGLLLQDLLKQAALAADGELPMMLPVVVYSGERAWTCSTSMAGLRGNDDALDCYQPELRYLLVDLVRQSGATGAGNVVLALFQCTPSGLAEYLLPALDCIATWLNGQRRDVLRRAITRWVTRHLRVRFKRINIPWNCTLEEAHAMYARRFDTFEDQLAYELKQKSRQEGLQAGLQHNLTRLLVRDSGPLPAAAVKRISIADPEQLQEWLDQVIEGQRPTALLDP